MFVFSLKPRFCLGEAVPVLTFVLCLFPLEASAAGVSDRKGSTYLSVEGPRGDGAAGAPILKSITAKYDVMMRNGMRVDIQPEFHFVAPHGDAVRLRRALVETDSDVKASDIRDAPIRIAPGQQVKGAVIKGGWPCGQGHYHVTLLAWLEDVQGRRGNALQYTIHCNELLMN